MTATLRNRTVARWALWTAGFIAFPLAGLAGELVGPVDDPVTALLGGAVTGLVVGIGQTVAALGALPAARWIPATTIGMALGLLLGAATVGYGTTLPELALMGLLTGLPLGVAQAFALPAEVRRRWLWAVTTPLLWALGWTVTTAIGVDVEAHYSIFGSAGAVTFAALSGGVLFWLLRVPERRARTAAA